MSAAGVRSIAFSFGLLGRDETRRAVNREAARQIAARVHPFRETKVAHQRFAVAVEENVPRFEIAVQDARACAHSATARVTFASSRTHSRGSALRPAAACCKLPPVANFIVKNGSPSRFADFVDRQDVRVIETCGGFRFPTEPLERVPRIAVITQDALERDDAAGMALLRPIDHAHPAAADLFENVIIAETPVAIRHVDLGQHGIEGFLPALGRIAAIAV